MIKQNWPNRNVSKFSKNDDSSKEVSLQMSVIQRKQWTAFSAQYERWCCGLDGVITKVQEEFQCRNADLLSIAQRTLLLWTLGMAELE